MNAIINLPASDPGRSPASDINVVLFGPVGCGKSSIINLLAGRPIAPVSTNMEPCTKRPRCYRIPIGERQFRVWDTTGFCLPRGGTINPLSSYEQAHAVLRNLAEGAHVIVLCSRKDGINPWLRSLYWFINNFLFAGRAPVAFVVTHFDTPDTSKKSWWDRNQHAFVSNTNIPIQSIPHVHSTTVQTGCEQSRQDLRSFLEECAATATPVPLRLHLPSHEAASAAISDNCDLTKSDAAALVDKFNKPRNPLNVVLFGEAGAGKSSVVDIIAGQAVARVSSAVELCTSESASYTIDTPAKQFIIWDTVGFNGVVDGQDVNPKAVMNAAQLIRDLFAQRGIDLLVFVKDCSKPTTSELNYCKFLEEFLCEGQVPVAVVYDAQDTEFTEKLTESRLTVRALFDGCFSCPKGEEISVQLRGTKKGEEMDHAPEGITVEKLVTHCGLKKELAKDVNNGSG